MRERPPPGYAGLPPPGGEKQGQTVAREPRQMQREKCKNTPRPAFPDSLKECLAQPLSEPGDVGGLLERLAGSFHHNGGLGRPHHLDQ